MTKVVKNDGLLIKYGGELLKKSEEMGIMAV